MSQETSYRTAIRIPKPKAALVHGKLSVEETPALDLLRRAAEEVAKERHGALVPAYRDCEGRTHRAWIAVQTPEFSRGIGLTVAGDGRVAFHYDSASAVNSHLPELAGQVRFINDQPDNAKRVCAQIVSHYVALAARRALESLDCSVRVEASDSETDTKAVIHGTDAAGRERVVHVSARGEVYLDLNGFAGTDCQGAEQELRARLAEFGLELETTWQRRKQAPASVREPQRVEVESW